MREGWACSAQVRCIPKRCGSISGNAVRLRIMLLEEGDTRLLLKKLAPVRLVRNNFRSAVEAAEAVGASEEELRILLGRGRAKRGIFEGDLEEGELEIGQVSALLHGKGVQSVASVMQELVEESRRAWERMQELDF